MTQTKTASATTDPLATTKTTTTITTTGTATPAGTDPIGPFSHTNTSTAAPSSVSSVQSPVSVHMSSPPHKPRFTRSPTPYTLQDMDREMDGSGENHPSRSSPQRSSSATTESKINLIPNSISHTTTSTITSQHSSNNNNSDSEMKNYTYLDNSSNDSNRMNASGQLSPSSSLNTIPSSNNNNNNNNNIDYKKPTAGWTLFAQLAKMTPEEVELIRLTKANTAANKQICAVPVTLIPPAVVQSNSSSGSSSYARPSETLSSVVSSSTSSTMEATLPNSSPKRTRQRRKELSPSLPPISLSVVSETSTLDRQHSSSSSEGDKSPDSRSSPSTNERGSLSPPSESSPSSSSLSSVPSSQSSPSPESSPRRRKRSKLDHPSSSMPPSALWSSHRRKSSISPPKSVLIDESKNMVFSYRSGSTIETFLPTSTTNNRLSTRDDPDRDTEDSEDYNLMMDEETYNRFSTRDVLDWDLPYLGYEGYKKEFLSQKNFTNTTASSSVPSSTSSSWWSLSSATAATPPSSNHPGSVEDSTKPSSSSNLSPSPSSWTPEAGGSLDSVLSDNGPNTFANIASSLDTLWSPPMLRRTFSEVSSARRGPRSSLSVTSSPAGAAGTGEGKESVTRRVPVLRRQASMPSLEREMSEESPFLEQPPVWSPAFSQPQESIAKIVATHEVKEPMEATATLAVQESTSTADSVSKEVVMMEVEPEVSADTLTAPGTATTPASGSTKGSRGAIRRRDTRQLHHPYRRRVPSTTSQDGSVDDSILRLPAQFRRSASFSGTTSTPPAQPVLRREASTTAYMDIL
ncbi:hypothetical protein K457DRAFT_155987 [Linnemannia elongata AG-77]|uniref:Uncharacterized protein n=1 Tax=Linnemannia elongata AG-77 TaxID=1314771 RepID=A0A197JUA6_9FUNG|nr:hypothetical protein K457DRAFT_155987 [Linnemannia elongata AG-77]